MKRLHLLAFLFLLLLILDETLASKKSSKENKKKKKTEGESWEAKKKYEGSVKQHKRKEREAPVQVDESEYQEVNGEELYKTSKESKKRYSKEEVRPDKYIKKRKLVDAEEGYVTKDKKKGCKKCGDERQPKKQIVEEEIYAQEDNENVEEEVYIPKQKKKGGKRPKQVEQKKYIREEEELNEEASTEPEVEEKQSCQFEEDVELDTELDVATIPSKKPRKVQRYIVEEEEANGVESVPAEKCYLK